MARAPALPIAGPAPMVPQLYLAPGITLRQVASIFRAHWRLAGLIALAAFLLVAGVTLLLPRTYTATASVMVRYEVNDPLSGREFPIGLLGSYMATQVELLGSPEVLLEVVDRLRLAERKRYAAGHDGDPATLRQWVARKLAKALEVQQGQGSQLIHVTYSSADPRDAAVIANAVVEVYSEQVRQRMSAPATEYARRYNAELDELKNKLMRAREAVTRFRRDNRLVEIDSKADVDVATLAMLEQRLVEAQNARRGAEAQLAAEPAVSGAVLGSQMVQALKTQIAHLEARMAELRTTLGPRHPEVVQVQSQLDAAGASLAQEVRRYAGAAQAALAAARQLEAKLATAVEQQRARLLEVRRQQDEGAKFVLELDSAESAYKRSLDGYDQVVAASRGQYTNVSVVSRATPPLKPSKPRWLANLALGAALGLALGGAIPFCYELLLRRVRCRDDLDRDLGVPVLVEFRPVAALEGP